MTQEEIDILNERLEKLYKRRELQAKRLNKTNDEIFGISKLLLKGISIGDYIHYTPESKACNDFYMYVNDLDVPYGRYLCALVGPSIMNGNSLYPHYHFYITEEDIGRVEHVTKETFIEQYRKLEQILYNAEGDS